MARKHTRFQPRKPRKGGTGGAHAPLARTPVTYEKKAPVVYGKAFVVMEDEQKQTFVFQSGAWVAQDRSMADWRQDCLVKELPQKVNRRTRYEVRCPVTAITADGADDSN